MVNILVCNQKGGVGKSLIADELDFSFERSKIPLSSINLDAQGGTVYQTAQRKDAKVAVIDMSSTGTVLIKVKATSDNPKTATDVANATAKAAAKTLPKMNHDANRITLYQAASAKDASATHHGHVKKYTAAGLVLGLIIGMTCGFIRTSWKDVK